MLCTHVCVVQKHDKELSVCCNALIHTVQRRKAMSLKATYHIVGNFGDCFNFMLQELMASEMSKLKLSTSISKFKVYVIACM